MQEIEPKGPHNHIPVLAEKVQTMLKEYKPKLCVDATFGRGGHTSLMLESLPEEGRVFSFDMDHQAIEFGQKNFDEQIHQGKLLLIHSPYSQIGTIAKKHGIHGKISYILADFGVSSPQIDQANRGFSFQSDGPLDMRMDNEGNPKTAEIVVNEYSEKQLNKIFYFYGEEKKSAYFAKAIVNQRQVKPFKTTLELADFVSKLNPYKKPSRKHPATRIFQAIRIEVNDELEEVKNFLREAFSALEPGGILAAISFHSLEDRSVKKFFQSLAKLEIPKEIVLTESQIREKNLIKASILKPFPITASAEEINQNPRARSAKMRVIRKIGEQS